MASRRHGRDREESRIGVCTRITDTHTSGQRKKLSQKAIHVWICSAVNARESNFSLLCSGRIYDGAKHIGNGSSHYICILCSSKMISTFRFVFSFGGKLKSVINDVCRLLVCTVYAVRVSIWRYAYKKDSKLICSEFSSSLYCYTHHRISTAPHPHVWWHWNVCCSASSWHLHFIIATHTHNHRPSAI